MEAMHLAAPIASVLPNVQNAVTMMGNTTLAHGSVPVSTHRSLYVGDLHNSTTEAELFEKFSRIGPVSSIRVCRDAITRRSLEYAYVNFQRPEDAERAIETMNFELLHNKPMRIMWSQRDPTLRRSTTGNIFIKNLDKRIDVKSLYDTFMLFGRILSCKIATDEDGNSKGYGFIHFENSDSASTAINKVNGMLLDDKKVYVAKFMPRAVREREFGDSANRFTNIYVKNFAEHLDDKKLMELFGKFGTITSAIVIKDANGKSRGFGFVDFDKHDYAAKAVEEMNGYELIEVGRALTVCRAQKKSERQAEFKRRHDLWKSELEKKSKGSNLYVKNLEENVDDAELRKIFEEFGNITSAKVMRDENGRSKCFAFVCFDNLDSAAKAKEEKHNKMHGTKPLYVVLAQRKEDRQCTLATRFMKNINQMRMNGQTSMTGTVYTPSGYFVAPSMQQAFIPGPIPTQLRSGTPRWNQLGYMLPNQGYAIRGPRPNGARRPPNYGASASYRNGNGTQGQNRNQIKPANIVYPHPTMVAQIQPHIKGTEQSTPIAQQTATLNSQTLSQATPTEQKQIIGETLYARVNQLQPTQNCGKITGMLLEMDMSELLHMLEDESFLKVKTDEAVAVLQCASNMQSQL